MSNQLWILFQTGTGGMKNDVTECNSIRSLFISCHSVWESFSYNRAFFRLRFHLNERNKRNERTKRSPLSIPIATINYFSPPSALPAQANIPHIVNFKTIYLMTSWTTPDRDSWGHEWRWWWWSCWWSYGRVLDETLVYSMTWHDFMTMTKKLI